MKRKQEYELFKTNLMTLRNDLMSRIPNAAIQEKAKSALLELQRKDAPLVLSIVRNSYFFDREGNKISNNRLIDVLDSQLYGYRLPQYYEVLQFIKERKF